MKLTAQNLVVININANYLTPEIKTWKEGRRILCAENCARQVFYGLEEDFEDFPYASGSIAERIDGAEAYVFLLKLLIGFKSPRFGETHIVNQFFERWKKTSRNRPPDILARYQKFIGHIRTDVNYVRNNLMVGFEQPEIELVARRLSGERPGDRIVVIADLALNQYLTPMTERVIRASENKQSRFDQFMALTHFDTSTIAMLNESIKLLRGAGKIRSKIESFDFRDIGRRISEADRVYVCIPMGEHHNEEVRLVNAWKQHAKSGAIMVHVRGTRDTRMLSSGIWKDCTDNDGYVPPEKIKEKCLQQSRRRDELVRDVSELFNLISCMRAEGRKVEPSELRRNLPHIFKAPNAA